MKTRAARAHPRIAHPAVLHGVALRASVQQLTHAKIASAVPALQATPMERVRVALQTFVIRMLAEKLFGIAFRSHGGFDRRNRGVIYVANHCSHLDTVAVLAALPAAQRLKLRIAAAQDYFFESPSIPRRLAVFLFGLVPVKRCGFCRTSFSAMVSLIKAGHSLLIFPEGTRSHHGMQVRVMPGAARLALACQCPIIPLRIENSAACLPAGARLPRRGRVHLYYGTPIEPGSRDAVDISRDIETALSNTVHETFSERIL
jgi:1-acyl-sn-glycerol-3-phosphate acyltransferase